ncbi:uncharacterized protein METZ01_LOCUS262741 [marine metagenome]|uniref:Uncharacterized protein n=1 Tax=marine metagenome TaxID=408172 RepID=A0A382JF83_9ZZZZ
MDNNTHYGTVKDWDEEFFKENGYMK